MATPQSALIINGHSNSGKSSFTRCLAAHADVDFLDIDREVAKSDADATSEERAKEHAGLWTAFLDGCWARGDTATLISELAKRKKPILVDWPYNPCDQSMRMVEAWKAAGIPAWWFHADPDAARQSCARRPNADWHLSNLAIHIQSVKTNEDRLRQVYDIRWFMALDEKHQRPSHGEMLHRIKQVDAHPWLQSLDEATFCTCVHPAL